MKTSKKTKTKTKSNQEDSSKALIKIANCDVNGVLQLLNTSQEGLSETEAKRRLNQFGLNEIPREKNIPWYIQLLKTVTNPPSLLLIALAVISLLTGSAIAALIIFLSL